VIFALLVACDGGLGPVAEPEPEPAVVEVWAAPGWDPLLESTLGVLVQADAAGEATLSAVDAEGTALWSEVLGLAEDGEGVVEWTGEPPAVGSYVLEVDFVRDDGLTASAEHHLEVVRLGFDQALADDDGGATSTRIPLTFHASGDLQEAGLPFVELAAIDSEGVAQDFPEPTEVLARLFPDANQPVAYTWDSAPLIDLVVSPEAQVGALTVGLEVDGWTVVGGGALAPGGVVTLQRDEVLATGPGVLEETLRLGFTVSDEDGEVHGLGAQFLPIRFYAMVDRPTFDEGAAVWPAAVEPMLRAIGGVGPDHAEVLDALVAWIYNDLGLTYDTQWGASYYTRYWGDDWERSHFYFSDFLTRRYGTVVNCSDCASILVAYANMIGVPLNYRILGWNFSLNQIQAIGVESFTNCPFGPFGCGFTYHAVTGGRGHSDIWDATLALDGDADPSRTPSEELLVQGIDEDDYLERLVQSGRVSYDYEAQGTFQ